MLERTTFCNFVGKKKHATRKSIATYTKIILLIFSQDKSKKSEIKFYGLLGWLKSYHRCRLIFFKHLEGTNGLYEIRVQSGNDIFRIFCFFDAGKLVVLANGFQKKSAKTPKSEMEKALKIKAEYEGEK